MAPPNYIGRNSAADRHFPPLNSLRSEKLGFFVTTSSKSCSGKSRGLNGARAVLRSSLGATPQYRHKHWTPYQVQADLPRPAPGRPARTSEAANAEWWVDWFNVDRTHGRLELQHPSEVETAYYAENEVLQPAI